MADRLPLVFGTDGLPQQLQSADILAAAAFGFGAAKQSAGANGYLILPFPVPIYLQWGQNTPSSGTATVTFPLAFPTACVHLTSDPVLSGVAASTTHTSFTLTTSKTGCTIAVRSTSGSTTAASTAPVQWFALGY